MKKIAVIAFIIVVIDQLSKFYIKTNFELGESVTVFADWFELVFVENPGMAYGMHWGGIAGKIMLAVLRWVLIGWGIWYITHAGRIYARNPYFAIPAALILAGALGNVIDSTFTGSSLIPVPPGTKISKRGKAIFIRFRRQISAVMPRYFRAVW